MNGPASLFFALSVPKFFIRTDGTQRHHQAGANWVQMDLIQQQLLGWATKGLSPEKIRRARYDGVVLKVWRPVGDR